MSRSRVLALPSDLPRRPRRGEAGSAYLVAILALVVLTIAGLSLALITQTETQIGANEKMVERAFYAADSGIAVSTARAMLENNTLPGAYRLKDPDGGSGFRLEHLVRTSSFFPISSGPCNLCSINDPNQSGPPTYERVTYAVDSTAIRQIPGGGSPIAERALSAMVETQPQEALTDNYVALFNPKTLPSNPD